MDAMTPATTFQDAKRELNGFVSAYEKRLLLRLAARIPHFVNSDHLTLLGFFALIAAGGCYVASRWNPLFLHAVNVMLLVNWFGDSLDGTLARYRKKSRPRYGFYVDHVADAVGTLFLFGGMAMSGYMSERVAFGLLAVYYLLMINSNLAAYTLGKFQISYGFFGPTELRIALAVGNVALIYHPLSTVFGFTYPLYDIGGCTAIIGMTVTLVIAVTKNVVTLYRTERI
jgi:phosphatidylglycerophosphate synthase